MTDKLMKVSRFSSVLFRVVCHCMLLMQEVATCALLVLKHKFIVQKMYATARLFRPVRNFRQASRIPRFFSCIRCGEPFEFENETTHGHVSVQPAILKNCQLDTNSPFSFKKPWNVLVHK